MSSEAEALERRAKEKARQREHQEEQQMLQQAFNSDGKLDRNWMKEVLGTDDLEDKLEKGTIRKIQAMLNKQWVLGNLTDAEAHDRMYWLDVQRQKILCEHPPEDSHVHSELRAFLLDDEREDLSPLSASERNQIDQIITGVKNMVTRSRNGFERQQWNTRIARTEKGDGDGEESGSGGRITGLFS